jgi:hypothetical protein
MREASRGVMLRASSWKRREARVMLYAGLDLSCKRLDFHLVDESGKTVKAGAAPPDADGLAGLAQRAPGLSIERHDSVITIRPIGLPSRGRDAFSWLARR